MRELQNMNYISFNIHYNYNKLLLPYIWFVGKDSFSLSEIKLDYMYE